VSTMAERKKKKKKESARQGGGNGGTQKQRKNGMTKIVGRVEGKRFSGASQKASPLVNFKLKGGSTESDRKKESRA